jgi:hypothetical protein
LVKECNDCGQKKVVMSMAEKLDLRVTQVKYLSKLNRQVCIVQSNPSRRFLSVLVALWSGSKRYLLGDVTLRL